MCLQLSSESLFWRAFLVFFKYLIVRVYYVLFLLPVIMAYSDILGLLFAIGVWCTAYAAAAVVGTFRVFNFLFAL